MRRVPFSLVVAVLSLSATAAGQTGTLDQSSPIIPAGGQYGAAFGLTSTYQQQIRAGIPGLMEGIELELQGNPGDLITIHVRPGDAGWNSAPPVWSGSFTTAGGIREHVFFDMIAADVRLQVGETYTLEVSANSGYAMVHGSWVSPSAGPPLYPEPIFKNLETTCMLDCGWRLGFNTWMNPLPYLEAINVAAGHLAVFQVSHAEPDDNVMFAFSLTGPGPSTVKGVQLALSQPITHMGDARANAAGIASLARPIPLGLTGTPVWLQAVEVDSLGQATVSTDLALVIQ